jgi:hypothetical protein
MTGAILPDQRDIRDVVIDYLDLLAPTERASDERERIIANCENLFSLIIRTCELARLHGEAEQLVCITFMRDVVQIDRSGAGIR